MHNEVNALYGISSGVALTCEWHESRQDYTGLAGDWPVASVARSGEYSLSGTWRITGTQLDTRILRCVASPERDKITNR